MFSGINDLKARLNHGLARLDAQESLSHVAPLKRKWVPAMAAGLGGSLMLTNRKRATDATAKRKTTIRDAIVIPGVVVGLLAGWRFTGTQAAKKLADGLARLIGQEVHDHSHNAAASVKNAVHHHADEAVKACSHHDHGTAAAAKKAVQSHDHAGHNHFDGLTLRPEVKDRLTNLFKPQLCDHGAEGFIKLTSIAAGSITGGALAGIAADAVNGENVKETSAHKLKEGLFQFVGNITFCTASILAFSTGGKALGKALVQEEFMPNLMKGEGVIAHLKYGLQRAVKLLLNPLHKLVSGMVRSRAERNTLKTMESLAQKEVGSRSLMPTSITSQVELIVRSKGTPHEMTHQLEDLLAHEVPHIDKASRAALHESLETLLEGQNYAGVHARIRQFVTANIKEDAAAMVLEGQKHGIRAEISPGFQALAAQRAENRGQLFGVLVGLVGGILGGAWTSNQVNDFMSKTMGFTPGAAKISFFQPNSPGVLQGKLGDRGLHWWDAILHLDDWPSALYLAGVKSLESIIGILYGISGYITGTAGKDYSEPTRAPLPNAHLYGNATPLNRNQSAFSRF